MEDEDKVPEQVNVLTFCKDVKYPPMLSDQSISHLQDILYLIKIELIHYTNRRKIDETATQKTKDLINQVRKYAYDILLWCDNVEIGR